MTAPGVGETGTASSGLNTYGNLVDGGSEESSSGVAAYATILVFDKNFNFIKAVRDQIDPNATSLHDLMTKEYVAEEEGYVYMYISNHSSSPQNVYFDDVKMTYTPTNVIQYNEYYPFGLQTDNSWTRSGNKNDYKYNAANELNSNTGWYEMFYRGYDPTIGRMLQVDPYATVFESVNPYNYGLNNPLKYNDPTGGLSKVRAGDGESHVDGVADWAISRMHELSSYNSWASDYTNDGGNGSGYYSLFEYTYRDRKTNELIKTEYKWEWVEGEDLIKKYERNQFWGPVKILVGQVLMEAGIGGAALTVLRKKAMGEGLPADKINKVMDYAKKIIQNIQRTVPNPQKLNLKVYASLIGAGLIAEGALMELENEFSLAPKIKDVNPEYYYKKIAPWDKQDAPEFGGGGSSVEFDKSWK
jgi:RHS repeat-associated protein